LIFAASAFAAADPPHGSGRGLSRSPVVAVAAAGVIKDGVDEDDMNCASSFGP